MDGKPQLKLIIFWKIRLELSGEASAAELAAGRDQPKDSVCRPGYKARSPEVNEALRELEGFKKYSGSSFVKDCADFTEGIREELVSFVFQEFILVSTVT